MAKADVYRFFVIPKSSLVLKRIKNASLVAILLVIFASDLCAQRPRFPDFFQRQTTPGQVQILPTPSQVFPGVLGQTQSPGTVIGAPQGTIFGAPQTIIGAPQAIIGAPQGAIIGAPQTFVGPLQGGGFSAPPATIGVPNFNPAPVFDPFRSSNQALPFSTRPSTNAANTVPTLQFPQNRLEVLPPSQPQAVQPFGFNANPVLPQGGFGTGGFTGPGIGAGGFGIQGPNVRQPFFSGFGSNFPRSGQSGQFFRRFREEYLPRLLERPRIRHTYLPGRNGNELQIHDTEFATTLTFPSLLFSEQPVRITPGFIAHFWDGPETIGPFGTGFDLPETAFSAFLTLEHFSNPERRTGIESNFTVGVYSDYEHLDSDSLRFTGVGLGWLRLNETNLLKFGAEYFDRIDLKLLPAFGLFIRPTADLEIDLYFPRPRIAQRIPSFRSLETWLYVSGEYGGGNWTVERAGGLDDRIDINDYRAILGIEWIGQRGITGFAETGYVFDRELVSDIAIPSRRLELQDTILLRFGIEF